MKITLFRVFHSQKVFVADLSHRGLGTGYTAML